MNARPGRRRPGPRRDRLGRLRATRSTTCRAASGWIVTNRTAATTGRLLANFAAAPRWSALPRIFASALRG
ncbi:hypothetical protein ACWCQZ_36090 [Streptomyces sp. NPDC002285]